MLILSLRTTAVLAIIFLIAEAPGQYLFSGNYTYDIGYAALSGSARADKANETNAVLVECLLPGKIRPLGSTTYITRENSIKTTKKECEARGGKIINPEEPEAEIPGGGSAEENDQSPR
jgi:hypothetical protein